MVYVDVALLPILSFIATCIVLPLIGVIGAMHSARMKSIEEKVGRLMSHDLCEAKRSAILESINGIRESVVNLVTRFETIAGNGNIGRMREIGDRLERLIVQVDAIVQREKERTE